MLFRSVLNVQQFFECLTDSERINVEEQMTTTKYAAGQVVFYENTNPFGIYLVNSGHVKLYKTGDRGKNQIFQLCGKGDLFGFHAVLLDEVYPDSAATLDPCELSFIPQQLFIDLIKGSQELSFVLLKMMSEEFRDFINQETLLSQKPVRERIAAVLGYLHEFYQEGPSEGTIPLNRGDLADLCGTVKETLVRVLREFKDEQLIQSPNGRDIVLLNAPQLNKVAGNL